MADLPHLLIVVLPRYEVVHQSDPVAQLLTQSVQELVCVPAARRAGEGEQLLAAVQCVGTAIRVLRGGRRAFQADVRVRVHAALVVDLIHRSGERLFPGKGQAAFTATCKKEIEDGCWEHDACGQCDCTTCSDCRCLHQEFLPWMTWLIYHATYSLQKLCVTPLTTLSSERLPW